MLTERGINPYEILWLDRSSTWMDSIRVYLVKDTLPRDSMEAGRVKRWANWFILYDEILYKGSCTLPLLHCVILEVGIRYWRS